MSASIIRLLEKIPDADMRLRRLNQFVNQAPADEVVTAIEQAARGVHQIAHRLFDLGVAQRGAAVVVDLVRLVKLGHRE